MYLRYDKPILAMSCACYNDELESSATQTLSKRSAGVYRSIYRNNRNQAERVMRNDRTFITIGTGQGSKLVIVCCKRQPLNSLVNSYRASTDSNQYFAEVDTQVRLPALSNLVESVIIVSLSPTAWMLESISTVDGSKCMARKCLSYTWTILEHY